MSSIQQLKSQSGAKMYAGCVGKTTLDNTSPEYKLTQQLASLLVHKGIGIIHGGYQDGKDGGTMQGYAHGASQAITKLGLHPAYNIGIPESRFDARRGLESRTGYNTQFCDPCPEIDTRCRTLIDNVDFLVVNPVAGNGTLREVFTMYEHNDISKPNNLGTGIVKPIIFYGDIRKQLFDVLNGSFAIGTKIENDPLLFFVDSLNEFEKIIDSLITNSDK